MGHPSSRPPKNCEEVRSADPIGVCRPGNCAHAIGSQPPSQPWSRWRFLGAEASWRPYGTFSQARHTIGFRLATSSDGWPSSITILGDGNPDATNPDALSNGVDPLRSVLRALTADWFPYYPPTSFGSSFGWEERGQLSLGDQ